MVRAYFQTVNVEPFFAMYEYLPMLNRDNFRIEFFPISLIVLRGKYREDGTGMRFHSFSYPKNFLSNS